MRDIKDGGSTDTVNVEVFCDRSVLAILDGFIKPLPGITTNEEAWVFNSAGPDGGYFPYLRIIGKVKDVAKALSAFLANKSTEFELECGPDTFKVKVKAPTEESMQKLLEQAQRFDLRQIVVLPPPEEIKEPGVIEGFAAKPKPPAN